MVKIVKNKLERMFSKSCRSDSYFWFMKLHNNPASHQNTPADYILDCAVGDAFRLLLVECKQVTCKAGKGRLAFTRLKQMHDLLAFDNLREQHKSYFCLAWYDTNWKNSDVYLVPIHKMYDITQDINKVSMNRTDAQTLLKTYKVTMKGGVFDLWQIKI